LQSAAGSGDDEKSGAGTPAPKRGPGASGKRGRGPAIPKKPTSNPKLTEKLSSCLKMLMSYKDSGGKKLSYPFIQLPLRREYPDYYEQIEHPMDLNRIRRKIDDDKYASLEQMSADMDLLCQNAQVCISSRDSSLIFI
jgi:SWI/SNF-related matrix-associated actin-dependent regulator of chromatin subfamily A protein 2/4